MTKPNEGMSHEYRTLLAAVLCLAVIMAFSYFNKPVPPQPQPNQPAAATQNNPANIPAQPAAQTTTKAPVGAKITAVTSTPTAATPPRAATAQRTVIVESDFFHVELSNTGAVVRSWILRQPPTKGGKFTDYTDESEPPKPLDVVHPEVALQLGGLPLSVVMDDKQLEARANAALYEVSTTPNVSGTPNSSPVTLQAPAEVDFTWSDGSLAVTKKLKFDASYIASVEVSVQLDGRIVPASLAWRGGFGDASAYHAAASTTVFYSLSGKVQLLAPNKLGQPDNAAVRNVQTGPLEYAGMEDQFFALAFLPPLDNSGARAGLPDTLGASMTLVNWSLNHEVVEGSNTSKEIIPEIAAGSAKGEPLNLRLYVGPKNLDDLKQIRPPLNELVRFGWMGIVAEPMFYLLRWIHKYVSNYGWAIILITIGLNMVLLPLRIKSTRSMQKMQKVAPEVKAIQDRYKKYSLKDPRKAKMNEEVMAVYSREGINPLGGCLPMLLQMPIWIGLYEMLTATIELRHAPWIGWIHDLSSRDPYFILPVLMAVSMYAMQKMTPTPGGDPAQQRMMMLMPIMFGGMFIVFPIASGLALYMFASNIVNMAQQYFLNKSNPVVVPAKGPRKR